MKIEILQKSGFFFLFLLALGAFSPASAQNYTSIANGNWTTAGTWNNTSGWGAAAPPLSGQGSGTISVNHNITMGSDYSSGSATLNISAGKTLTVNGDFAVGGGGLINVSGVLRITGNAVLRSHLNILPGGAVYVNGTLTVNNSNYLTVGTNVAPPPYADLVVYSDLISEGSGDIVVNRNGRLAAFGNLTGAGGGTLITVNNGGQAYIHGNVSLTGGGSQITNNNTVSPYGLYVGGTVTNSGGGSNTTTNTGDEVVLQNTNPPFFSWISNLPGSLLPVELLYFVAKPFGGELELRWATASEKNASHFVVERSANGIEFDSLGAVPAHGNSYVRQQYQLVDGSPISGRGYYRLKLVNDDTSVESLGVTFIDSDVRETVEVWPTIANSGDKIFARTNFKSEGPKQIVVLSSSGKVVTSANFTGMMGELQADLDAGIYFLRISAGDQSYVSRLVIR